MAACDPATTISSTDLSDLKKDITTIDTVVESSLDTTTTKDGKVINTLSGQLKLLGFIPPLVYAGGIVFTTSDTTKTVVEAGVVYYPDPAALPFTTSGTFIGDDDARFFVVQGLTNQSPELIARPQPDGFTTDILTDTTSPNAFDSDYYDTNKTIRSGAKWIKTGVNIPGKAGTFDLVNGFAYNVSGDEYKIDAEKYYLQMFGGIANITEFLTYTWKNKIAAFIENGTYEVTSQMLNLTANCAAVLICESGEATFNYTGSEIGNLLIATDVDDIQMKNINFTCNDLVNSPLHLQKTTGTAGVAGLFNVNAFDIKQTALTINPVGLLVSGGYTQVDVLNCTVDGLSYVDGARSGTGIAIIDFGGLAVVRGCIIRDISTPDDGDADGLKIFGTDVVTPTTFLGATAEIHNNVFQDCQGRWIKLQISDAEIHGNQFKLGTGFTTITSFIGVDCQSNNGNIHDNTIRIGAVTFGAESLLFGLQNVRNDGGGKTSYVTNNRCSSQTNIEGFVSCISEFGTNTFVIDDNEYLDASVNHFIKHRERTIANTDKINIYARNNKADGVVVNFYEPFDDIDFTNKLYVELVDNENFNGSFPSIYDQSKTTFSANANFRFRNNVGFTQRVNWVFDMDDLPNGNSFFTGSQTVTNAAPGIGTFFHVDTDGFIQRNLNTGATVEQRRSSTTGTSWNAWVTV